MTAFGEALTLPMTVLIVDDETEVADISAHVLKRQGSIVSSPVTGRARLRRLMLGNPLLVCSDINFPKSDGCEIARHVRGTIPGYARDPHVDKSNGQGPGQAVRAGASHHLCKPFSNVELTVSVKSAPKTLRASEII
jgi:CheY-like chemotaxis protein